MTDEEIKLIAWEWLHSDCRDDIKEMAKWIMNKLDVQESKDN